MRYLHVTGTVDAQGRFSTGWWSEVPTGTPQLPPGNAAAPQWEVASLDEAGEVLTRVVAVLTSRPVCPGDIEWRLDAVVPVPDNAASVTLLAGDAEILRRVVPRQADLRPDPAPGARLTRDAAMVAVHIDGPPPGPGAYVVASWEVPGQAPMSLGLHPVTADQTSIPLNLTDVPGGEGCRLIINHFDGIRQTTTSVEDLVLEARVPVPVIDTPQQHTELFTNTWLSLRGRLEGDGDPAAMEWFIDGQLVGTGTTGGLTGLAPGMHTIALGYDTSQTTVDITIQPAPADETTTPVWEPPWRSNRSVRRGIA